MTKKENAPASSSNRVSRREARRERESRQKRQRYIAIGVITVGVVLILALVFWANRPQPLTLENVNTEQAPGADGLAWGGPEDAAVVLVDFSDFQCSFCGRHALQTVPDLMARYGDNPNFRYEYRPFVLFAGSVSQNAAEAAVCAGEQNLFWPYHDTLFAHQGAEASGVFTDDNLRTMAEAVGMNMGAFNDCYRSGVAKRSVNDAVSEGRRLGVTSTPSFFLNGELISGAQPASYFIDAIDAALANAGA